MATFRISTSCVALVVLFASASLAVAQRSMPKDKFSSAGKIKAAQNGVFHVVNVSGDQWLVKVDADAENIVLKGQATGDWLQPGMPVKFEGVFHRNKAGLPQGEALEPISKLKVFSLREDSRAALQEMGKRGSFLAGGKDDDPPMEKVRFSVTGVLVKYKRGQMSVAVGNTQVQAELAGDAEIDVDINDLTFARAGDEMEFEGWHYAGQNEHIHATRIWVTAENPLGSPEATKASASAEERMAIRRIDNEVSRARRLYNQSQYKEAAEAVRGIVADWEAMTKTASDAAREMAKAPFERLQVVHAMLEMEGYELPALTETVKPAG